MHPIKIGILRETKIPYDKRVPLSPVECKYLLKQYPQLEIFVQPSEFRCFTDSEYKDSGITLKEDLSRCDILLGVKEVDKKTFISNKKYLFFSHTIKKQPHNRELLKEIINKKIQLIDYECLTDDKGNRIIGFGRYAGIVGAYNAFRGYGLKYGVFNLKPAFQCKNREELNEQLKKVKLPNIKIAITGGGRVANGVIETLGVLELRKVTPFEFLSFSFNEPVYCQIHSKDYYEAKDGSVWNSKEYYSHPSQYRSCFEKYTKVCDLLITAHFWDPLSDRLFTADHMKAKDFKIKLIADITCDINGSIPSTIRSTSIEKPFYDFDPVEQKEIPSFTQDKITIMAVDNLPCELPRDSSVGFGKELIEKVFPSLFVSDEQDIIERASITKDGKLTSKYDYLSDYIA